MVWSVIQNFKQGLKYRGGWYNLILHMYTNGDYPFKFGTYMGSDAAGNRYYENRVDYPFGQHRWVEPGDINNFDSSSIPPEWHGWMVSMNDVPPSQEEEFFESKKDDILVSSSSSLPLQAPVGHQEELFNFHHLHNQSQVRARGYGIGNPIVGLPPHAPDAYYTQPGSPYNEASRKPLEFIGELPGGRKYKSLKWKERLETPEEKAAMAAEQAATKKEEMDKFSQLKAMRKAAARNARGGTVVGSD